jgi:aspartate 1-decarboxylase
MFHKLLRAKIHRATVTDAQLEYVGSLTIDKDVMAAAGILPNECIQVVDITNGTRHWTYAIEGASGSGVMCVNGAAAHLVKVGDRIIVMAFGYFTPEEAAEFTPRIVLVDDNNHVARHL